jgi:hypothetical protein
MLADRFLIGTLEEAVNLAVRIVVQLQLADAELVGGAISRPLRYLLDGYPWTLQVIVIVHEFGHYVPS